MISYGLLGPERLRSSPEALVLGPAFAFIAQAALPIIAT
jgi:hypothetical protein